MPEDIDEILGLAKNETPDLPKDGEVKELSLMVQDLVNLRRRIERGEEVLKGLKQEELRISQETIPSKMDEIGVTAIELPTGQKVSYKPFYSGKIRPESEQMAYDWLENNDHGGVIKGEAIFSYRRKERDEMVNILKTIEDTFGLTAVIKLGVHHSTLRALIREVIENGGDFPPDLFDVFIGRKTEIK